MGKTNFSFISHKKPWRYQEGELTVTRGGSWTGPGCHIGCGVLLYTDKEGNLVKIEGDPENPFNKGRLCVRCLDLIESVYHKDRLRSPMKRRREDRGKDRWEEISWDEAYEIVAGKLMSIREESGAESVIVAQGTGRDIIPYQTRFCWAYGSPNQTNIFSGCACYVPRIAGMTATTGSTWVADCGQQFIDRYENEQYVVPEVMFVWGNNPIVANADGFFGHWVVDLMRRGMKIVMIDPKMTWLGSKAKLHLPVRPGTDAALALGMLNVIISEELYDREFVEKWCYGFDELAEHVKKYTPSYVASTTWVEEWKIIEAARLLAQSKPATLQWGVAVDMTKEAVPAGQAIMALFEITGNMDVPGGLISPPAIVPFAGGWGFDLLSDEQKAKRIGIDRYPLYRTGFKKATPEAVLEAMRTGKPYPIRAAWFQTTNFLACMAAHPAEIDDLMMDLEFSVFVDLYMTPTAMAYGDIVLPACTYPERNGVSFIAGVQQVEAINQVVDPQGAKSDMEIILELGKIMDPQKWPWDTVEDMFSEMLSPTGMSFQELREAGPLYLPFEYRKYEKGLMRSDGKPGFNTSTGLIELNSVYFEACGLDPLPVFEEPVPGPVSTPELLEKYPFVLVTGARTWGYFHSEHRQIPRLRAMRPEPLVEVHPDALEELGLHDGQWVWIENDLGRAKRKVTASSNMDKRIVAADHGWWYPEAGPENNFEIDELCINNLVAWGCGKSGFGANYKCSLCRIYAMEGDEGHGENGSAH